MEPDLAGAAVIASTKAHTPAGACPSASLTERLQAWQRGEGAALSSMFELAYAELKRIAAGRLRQAGAALTLTPTELLHESVLRVIEGKLSWQNRAHFYASMSLYMRAVLLDHLRARGSDKRGGGQLWLTLEGSLAGEESGIAELLALDQALLDLEDQDRQSSTVLHLAIFGGLGRREIAEVMRLSLPTVDRELRFAKAWVHRRLTGAS